MANVDHYRHKTAMSSSQTHPVSQPTPKAIPMGFGEFVAMIAALMSLTALAIDAMLPALGMISSDFALGDANDRQWVVGAFLIGFSFSTLFYGPLCDRFGRKRILLPALIAYVLFAVLAAFSPTFQALVLMRLAGGVAAGAIRIVITSVVRDRFAGDAMARVMSLAFMIFTLVPMLAPTLGYVILLIADWRWIFGALGILGTAMIVWTSIRLPETLDPENVIPLSLGNITSTWRQIIFNRTSTAYMLAAGLVMGPLFGFVTSAQQIFSETFGQADLFPFIFGGITLGLAVSGFFNSRIVMKFGARPIAHSAITMTILFAALQLAMTYIFGEQLFRFIPLLAFSLAMTGFVNSNCSSIAMEPFGKMAGAASSFQAFSMGIISSGIGALIGQLFDGTTISLTAGFVLCNLAALLIISWGEKGRLYQRKNAPKAS